MKRQILCPACAVNYQQCGEDIARGIEMRRVIIKSAKTPPVHTLTVVSRGCHVVTDIPLMCDSCATRLHKKEAVAISEWIGDKEEMPDWEWEFGGPDPANEKRPSPNYNVNRFWEAVSE